MAFKKKKEKKKQEQTQQKKTHISIPIFQWCSQFNDNTTTGGKTQVPIRLIVPASQCGSLIGKYQNMFAIELKTKIKYKNRNETEENK